MNILFVCKYNRFRSKVAEAYFNKINKNKFIKTDGAGIFGGWYPLDKLQVRIAKKYGIKMKGKPESLSFQKIKNADLIVLVANDVPKKIFKNTFMGDKRVIQWKIKDVKKHSTKAERTEKSIIQIIKRIDNFVEKEQWKR
jgi:protein-tyrosine-phosphatase